MSFWGGVNDDVESRARDRFAERWLSPAVTPAARYALALGFLFCLVLLQRLARPYMSAAPFMAAYAAVVFASWFCGVGPSIAVVATSVVAAIYLFFDPLDRFSLAGSTQLTVIAGFAITSTFIVALGARARASFARLRGLSADLTLSEARWRSLAEAIPQIVWTANGKGEIDYQNNKWLELTGRSIDEARRLGWSHTVHPDDVPQVLGRWRESVQTGTVYEVESRLKRASDGTWRWFLSRAVPLRDEAGQVVKWFGTSTDIDGQKRASELARFLADAGDLLSSSLDYEATLQRVARAAIPYFADWASVDLVGPDGAIHRVAVAHIDPAKVRLAEELHRKYPPKPDDPAGVPHVLRTGKPELRSQISDELLVQLIPDAELLRIIRELALKSSLVVPIRARGQTLGALTFIMAESGREYTGADLAVAEELARRAGIAIENSRLYAEAQTASRVKDEFLSTLSHELRTPLTAIVGWSHMLAAGVDAERARRGAEVIQRNAMAQAQLIDDLLDVSRIVTGKMRLQVRPFQPVQVVEAAIESVRPSAEAKAVRIQAVLDPAAGPILGDPDRLQQIVWNLLSNSIKFTPRGGRVGVRLARVDSHVEVEVTDTGVGIDPDFLPRIFERFTQADASSSRSHGGLGLGMSIARHLTELHGGTIEARSEGRNRGAAFLVKLPVAATQSAQVEERRARPQAPALQPASAGPATLESARIVVVEDADDAREMIREILENAGARVRVAASAAEARELLAMETPDLLVSDVGMAGEDGYALIRNLRSGGLRFPAIALTAYARSEDRTRALLEGFDFHLAKPIDPTELVAVASALRRRRASRD